MTTLRRWQIAACAAMLVGSGSVSAQPEGETNPPPPPHHHEGDPMGGPKGPPPHKPHDGSGDHRGGGMGSRREGMRQRMYAQLFRDIELTPEQQVKVKASLENGYEARKAWMEEHRDEIRDAMRAMREAKQSEDEGKIATAKDALKSLIESSPKLKDVADEVRATLTDEQREVFTRNVDELQARMESRGMRGPDGPGRAGGPHMPGMRHDRMGDDKPKRGQHHPGPPPAEGDNPPPAPRGDKLEI